MRPPRRQGERRRGAVCAWGLPLVVGVPAVAGCRTEFPTFSPGRWPLFWPLTLIAMLLVLYLLLGRARRRALQRAAPMGDLITPHEHRRLREMVDRTMIDSEKMFREMSAVLTTKTALLEQLIADADGRIRALERLMAAPEPPGSAGASPSRVGGEGEPEPAPSPRGGEPGS